MRLLVHVWREVSRHVEIREVAERLMPALQEVLPLQALGVRKLELRESCLETVVDCTADGAVRMTLGKTPLVESELKQFLNWAQQTHVSRVGDDVTSQGNGDPPEPRWLGDHMGTDAGSRQNGDILVGPLLGASGAASGLLLLYGLKEPFTLEHVKWCRRLLEPFAVALENDSRLREMQALREALEADKRALLSRLDRQDITDAIVGEETGLRPVMQRVEQVAASTVPVLILGETGSGKEVVARAIHARSRRATGPILRVNCGAIPPELVDSELFGHERGSFTGAATARQGWFERAHGGTLFLDEIGELPAAAQVRMLRILQDGCFERVGGQRPTTVDVRVVAATNADLHAMVAQGKFRQDLWYRISVFPIHLPPLRDRPGDIPLFAAHFAARAGKRLGGRPLVPTPDDIALMLDYPWPGNVRELAAVIERAAILGNGRRLEIALALGSARPLPPAGAAVSEAALPRITPVARGPGSLADATRQHIEAVLKSTLGRVDGPFGAAKILGVNPHTLRSRMRKLGIDWTEFRPSSHGGQQAGEQ